MARITALAAAVGAIVAAKYGESLGTAVQTALVSIAGLVAAVAVREHHANARAQLSASVQVGAHQTIADSVAGAVHHALVTTLAPVVANGLGTSDVAAAPPAESSPTAPPGATVPGA